MHLKSSALPSLVVRRTDLLTIGELADRAGVATSALRFYEQRGLIRSVRTPGNQRRYQRATLRRVALIRVAQGLGLSLHDIGEAVASLPEDRIATREDWARLSSSWRDRLDERIASLSRLRDKLTGCIGCGCLSLQRCALYNQADRISARGGGPRYLLGDATPEFSDPASAPRRRNPRRRMAREEH